MLPDYFKPFAPPDVVYGHPLESPPFLKAWQEFVRAHSEQQRGMRSALTDEQATTLAMSEALVLAAADKWVAKVIPICPSLGPQGRDQSSLQDPLQDPL